MTAAWKLIIEDDAGKQITVPFAKDVITIGRKEGNTIRLTDRNVSRFHCKLQKENGHVLVEDLGSYNGIRLNGDRIAGRVAVNEGDTIQIGDYHLAFHAADGARLDQKQAASSQHASSAVDGQETRDDDEFAGDTQRWEPPSGMAPIGVGAVQTQEEPLRAPISEETARGPIQGVANLDTQEGGFLNEPTQQQTERFASPSQPQGPPTLEQVPVRRPFAGNLEPTVRQSAAPAPVSGVSATPPPPLSPHLAQETRPERPMPGSAPLSPPLPPPLQPATPAAPPRAPTASSPKLAMAHGVAEQTESVRPAPVAGEDTSCPRLFIVSTVFCGSAYRVNQPEMVIGRTEENDITIEHRSVSRNHAKVVREGDRVRIMDLKSANGVLVNGEEIEAAVLRPGDIIELGRVKIRFVPIGERFAVTPEEVERARIADVANEEFEGEGSTGITNPVRPRSAVTATEELPPRRNNVLYFGIGAAFVVLAAIAGVVLMRGDSASDEPQPEPPVVIKPPTPTPPAPTPPTPPPPTPAPVDVQPVDATPPADPAAPDPVAPDTADDPGRDPKPRPRPKPPDRQPQPRAAMTDAEADDLLNKVGPLNQAGKREEAKRIFKRVRAAKPNMQRVKTMLTISPWLGE